VQWHWTHALGGIALLVPADQAADAAELLAEFPITRRPQSWLRRLLAGAVMAAVFLLVSVPPPPSGFFPTILRPVSGRLAAVSGDTA
jgi:hypothetical protein